MYKNNSKNILIKSVSFFLVLGGLVGCGGKTSGADSIEVTTLPTILEYKIDDELSLAGGVLTAKYLDNTTKTISLDDENVHISSVNMSKAGKKSVVVTYDGCRTRFNIKVNPYQVNFDLGGKGDIEPIYLVEKGVIDEMPEDPTYEGFKFGGWFTNNGFSNEFDLTSVISSDITLYAYWINNQATYYDVVLDNNYFGSPKNNSLKVLEGDNISKPDSPKRNGYEFIGWFNQKEGGELFDFSSSINEDTKLYAHWNRVASGRNEYVFEAEDVSLEGKSGKGYSGEAEGKGLVQREGKDSTLKVSNDRFVGYTYVNGFTLDFDFASDKADSNAKIVLRLSGEFADFTLTPDMFIISLNGKEINYSPIVINGVPNMNVKEFADFVILENASIKDGANNLQLKVNNDVNWIGGDSVAATAPLIDCLKITTDSVLWWNGEENLPANNYRK